MAATETSHANRHTNRHGQLDVAPPREPHRCAANRQPKRHSRTCNCWTTAPADGVHERPCCGCRCPSSQPVTGSLSCGTGPTTLPRPLKLRATPWCPGPFCRDGVLRPGAPAIINTQPSVRRFWAGRVGTLVLRLPGPLIAGARAQNAIATNGPGPRRRSSLSGAAGGRARSTAQRACGRADSKGRQHNMGVHDHIGRRA